MNTRSDVAREAAGGGGEVVDAVQQQGFAARGLWAHLRLTPDFGGDCEDSVGAGMIA